MRVAVPVVARAPALGAAAFLLVSAILFAAIMAATGGAFSFTLDDPYIHLAMAEEIGRGGYGVNPGEAASASSSALYPYLLAILLRLGLGQGAALLINLAAGTVSTVVLMALAQEGGLVNARTSPSVSAALATVLVLVLNLAGLAFSGMEHGLHVALALAALWGFVRLEREGRPAAWLVVVLAVAPLVRFEGAALTAAAAVALSLGGRWRTAALVVVLAGAGLGLFAWSLHARGLPWLPSSVLAKAGDGAHGLGAQLLENLRAPGAPFVALGAVVPLAADVRAGRLRRLPSTTVFAALALAAQLAVGTFGVRYGGWLHRYEAWAVVLAAGALLLVGGRLAHAAFARSAVLGSAAVAATALLFLAPYLKTTLEAPADARSIRLQQREMHRFAADVLRAPVGVNDLGWVSFANDHEVLDFWGLASEAARRARQAHLPPQWMDDLARAHGVRAVMIYDPWIGRRPASWVRLGELRARVRLTVGPRVAFYATSAADVPQVRRAVQSWARGLPAQDLFVSDDGAHDGEFTPKPPA